MSAGGHALHEDSHARYISVILDAADLMLPHLHPKSFLNSAKFIQNYSCLNSVLIFLLGYLKFFMFVKNIFLFVIPTLSRPLFQVWTVGSDIGTWILSEIFEDTYKTALHNDTMI